MHTKPYLSGTKPILVFVQDFHAYHQEFIRTGVANYFSQEARNLSYTPMELGELKAIFGDTLDKRIVAIGSLRNPESIQYFVQNNIPCFNFNSLDKKSNLGFNIFIEGEATIAAEYFTHELQIENLGFVGRLNERSHKRRLREFNRVAEIHGFPVTICPQHFYSKPIPYAQYIESCSKFRDDSLQELLTNIKKPAGIFCCDDRIALKLYFTCKLMDISVPDEVSILGIGSKSNSKAAWTHPVSVVEIDHQRMGYLGAQLLDQYIGTGKRPDSIRLDPSGIHHSQTTIHRRVSDAFVREAIVIIQQHPELTVAAIADQLNINRNVLDLRFQRATNLTVSKMLENERFKKAKALLSENNYSIESIAALAGFPNRRSMRRCFQHFAQMSPRQFRNHHHLHPQHSE